MSVPAHKSGTAGQVILPRCASAQTCTCSPGRCEDKRYGVVKTALGASKSVLAPYPQEPWESRYKRLVGALEEACDKSESFHYGIQAYRYILISDIRKIIKENT